MVYKIHKIGNVFELSPLLQNTTMVSYFTNIQILNHEKIRIATKSSI